MQVARFKHGALGTASNNPGWHASNIRSSHDNAAGLGAHLSPLLSLREAKLRLATEGLLVPMQQLFDMALVVKGAHNNSGKAGGLVSFVEHLPLGSLGVRLRALGQLQKMLHRYENWLEKQIEQEPESETAGKLAQVRYCTLHLAFFVHSLCCTCS